MPLNSSNWRNQLNANFTVSVNANRVRKDFHVSFRIFKTMQLHASVANAIHVLQIFANRIMSVVLLNKINTLLSCEQVHTHLIFFNSYLLSEWLSVP